MATEQVKVQISADGSKVGSEVNKVKKDLSGLSEAADKIGVSWSKFGGIIGGALSVSAAVGFLKSVNASADALNDLSGRLGASASGLQSLQVAATLAGGSTESMNTALAKMSSTLGEALNGNKQATTAFQQLGLSAKDLAGLKADEAFRKIADATAEIPNTFQRAAVAQDIFGKGAKDIAGLLAEGGAAIDDVNQKLVEQGAAIDDLDIARIGVMNDELQFQQTVVTNLGTKFLSGLSPAIGVATSAVSDMLSSLGGATEAGRGFGVVLTAAIKLVEAGVYSLSAVFESMRFVVAVTLQAITNGVANITGALAAAAGAVGADGLAAGLRNASEGAAGFAASFGDVATSARLNASAAAAAAIKAGEEMLRAGEIFDQQAAALEARAQAAVNRVNQAQGGFDPALAGDQKGDEIGLTSKQLGGAFAQVDALKVPDIETDYRLVADRLLYDAKLIAQEEYEKTALGKLDAFNQSWLGSMLYSNELAIAAEEGKNATLGGLMGELVSMGIQQGGAMGKAGKALAIAQTVWSTGTAIMKTMASLPWPANIGAAALVAAKGAMQLANIKKTNIGSSGSIAGTGGGGGSTQSAALRDVPAGTQPSTESQQKSAVQIVIQGNLISNTETARWLGEVLGEAINNQDLVFINGNSRQAMELAGA